MSRPGQSPQPAGSTARASRGSPTLRTRPHPLPAPSTRSRPEGGNRPWASGCEDAERVGWRGREAAHRHAVRRHLFIMDSQTCFSWDSGEYRSGSSPSQLRSARARVAPSRSFTHVRPVASIVPATATAYLRVRAREKWPEFPVWGLGVLHAAVPTVLSSLRPRRGSAEVPVKTS